MCRQVTTIAKNTLPFEKQQLARRNFLPTGEGEYVNEKKKVLG